MLLIVIFVVVLRNIEILKRSNFGHNRVFVNTCFFKISFWLLSKISLFLIMIKDCRSILCANIIAFKIMLMSLRDILISFAISRVVLPWLLYSSKTFSSLSVLVPLDNLFCYYNNERTWLYLFSDTTWYQSLLSWYLWFHLLPSILLLNWYTRDKW